jgi:hypothetical protein
VLVPEDRTGQIMNALILGAMALLSGISLIGAWLMLDIGELLGAGSLCGVGLFFAWMIDQRSCTPETSLSRKLSQASQRTTDPKLERHREP